VDRLRRRPRRTIAGLLLFAFVLLLVVVIMRALSLRADATEAIAHLREAQTVIHAGGFELSSEDAERAGGLIELADASLARVAASLAGDPVMSLARLMPVLSEQIAAADDLIHAARLLTSRHANLEMLLQDYAETLVESDGRERLAALARFVAHNRDAGDELMSAFTEADQLVEATSSRSLLGPISEMRSAIKTEFDRVRPLLQVWVVAQTVVPDLFAVGDQKRYLVVALDNAELRPMGGLVAAFATPTFADGRMQDLAFRDVLDIDSADQNQYVAPPPGLRGHLLGNLPWQVADAGWWPDFAQSAQEARRLFAIETGDAELDGVIAFTPELVDALLKMVGPVEIPDAGITVHAGETYLVSLEQVEILNRGAGRKQFLAQLASAVLERLLALPPNRYPEVVAALDLAGRRRQLQIALDDEHTQAALQGIGWSAPFAFPSTGDRLAVMESNVAPVSKLDVLLDLDHALDVHLTPAGNAQEQLVTTYTNHFAESLPPELEAVRLAFRSGNLGSYVRRYLVPAARDLSVSSDGIPALTGPERVDLESGSLCVANYQLIGPGVTQLETRYVASQVVVSASDPAVNGIYRLSFIKQPGRDRDTLTVSVTVPEGTIPVSWSEGGTVNGRTVTFRATTEFDRAFEVTYDAP
jgi:hypothetical protein